MSQRFNKNTKADFNLDEYIEEKANEFPGQKSQLPTSEKQDGTFFRNIIVIAFLVVATLLYFNDWNPVQAYNRYFGSGSAPSELAEIPTPPEIETPTADVINAQVQAALEAAEARRAARVSSLEQQIESALQSEEVARITEESIAFALESAMNALENMDFSNLAGLQNLEALGGLEALENLEGLEALEALGEIDFSNATELQNGMNEMNMEQYTNELIERNLAGLSAEDIQAYFDAGISPATLARFNDLGLLDQLETQDIIDLFDENQP